MSRTLKIGEALVAVAGRAGAGRARTGTVLGPQTQVVAASWGEERAEIEAAPTSDGGLVFTRPDGRVVRAVVSRDADGLWVTVDGATFRLREFEEGAAAASLHGGDLEAPMPGKVFEVRCSVGDQVTAGQTLLVLEAMKMEHALKSPSDGVVTEVRAEVGALVAPGAPLVVVEADGEGA